MPLSSCTLALMPSIVTTERAPAPCFFRLQPSSIVARGMSKPRPTRMSTF